MALRKASDSLATCDQSKYNNLYSLRPHVDFRANHVPPNPTDTIEISKDKLKQEAIRHLKHPIKYVIAQNSFMRIGKYLFLAIAFPPYIALYEIPRWLLIQGIHFISTAYLVVWKTVSKQTKKGLSLANRELIKIFQAIQKSARVLIHPVVKLALEIRRQIKQRRDQVYLFLQNRQKKLKLSLRSLLAPIHKQMRIKILKDQIAAMREKGRKKFLEISTSVNETIQGIKKSPENLLAWGQVQFQKISEKTLSLKVKWEKPFLLSHQIAKRATDWIYKFLKKEKEHIKREIQPLVKFYRGQILPFCQKMTQIITKSWKQTREFFQQKHHKALAFLEKQQENVKLLTQKQINHLWITHLPSQWQQWVRKFLSNPTISFICKTAVKSFCLFVGPILKILTTSLKIIEKVAEHISNAIGVVQSNCRLLRAKSIEFVLLCEKKCLKFLSYCLYYFLLGVVITGLLLIWATRSGIHLMNSVKNKMIFSLKNI